jgi:2-succinyl-5-enolpyruvyl-6-hydroxy-3-cyclohexene-1-carboxylate synthase
LPQSVPSPSEVQATYAATLFDEWIRLGLRDVVLCPGSRSTPLALACAARDELQVHVRIDERSAGFFALGRALVTRVPVAMVVTSGTAAAELHACVAEASQASVPLLILTADRPPELHGVGAPQTRTPALREKAPRTRGANWLIDCGDVRPAAPKSSRARDRFT